MIIRLNGSRVIENLRHYSPEIIEDLRALLAEGALAIPDPRRAGFYDVQDGDRVFFIHVCPSGRVLLLATWLNESAPTPAPEQEMAVVART